MGLILNWFRNKIIKPRTELYPKYYFEKRIEVMSQKVILFEKWQSESLSDIGQTLYELDNLIGDSLREGHYCTEEIIYRNELVKQRDKLVGKEE